MKLIIDIEDEALERLSTVDPNLLYTAIKNGKPYKETASGDLISREALKEKLKPCEEGACEPTCKGCRFRVVTAEDIDNAPTVEEIYKEKYDQLKEAYSLLAESYEYEVTKEERPQGGWVEAKEHAYIPESVFYDDDEKAALLDEFSQAFSSCNECGNPEADQ